jgi:hypothetical protein
MNKAMHSCFEGQGQFNLRHARSFGWPHQTVARVVNHDVDALKFSNNRLGDSIYLGTVSDIQLKKRNVVKLFKQFPMGLQAPYCGCHVPACTCKLLYSGFTETSVGACDKDSFGGH